MYTHANARRNISVLLFSLLWHLLLLCLLLKYQNNEHAPFEKREELSKKQKKEWADTGPTSAPVIFYDIPDTPATDKQQENNTQSDAIPETSANIEQEHVQQPVQPEPTSKQEHAYKEQTQQESRQEHIPIEEIPVQTTLADDTIEKKQESAEEQSTAQEDTDGKHQPSILKTGQNHKQEQPAPETQSPQQKTIDQKLTLAQLAQNFFDHVNQHNAAMAVVSDNKGEVDAYQLKQLRYLEKIMECLVNAYKINNHKLMSIEQAQEATILLGINKDGTLRHLEVTQSSGNSTVDLFAMAMFKDASSSFPPIPKSFDENYFYIPVTFGDLRYFQSTRFWHLRN